MGKFGMWEILLIVAVILLLFGSTKIPQLMRSLGSGVNEFKKGLKESDKPDKPDKLDPPPVPDDKK